MASSSSSKEDFIAAHKKALKSLEGEKRAALKKAKSLKGKKGKEALANTEAEFDAKLKELIAKHEENLKALDGNSGGDDATDENEATTKAEESISTKIATTTTTNNVNDDNERERKLAKARRKREKAKQKELEKEQTRLEEEANAGPSARQMELDLLHQQLTPLHYQIAEIPSDGNCLYRAIAAQLHDGRSYQDIRNLCATMLEEQEEELAPFLEYDDDNNVTDFASYVHRVRNSSDWGGHVELRAIQSGLEGRSIIVYRAATPTEPLVFGNNADDDNIDKKPPIRLSYHLHYYSLGEHYNQVIAIKTTDDAETAPSSSVTEQQKEEEGA